MNNSSYILKLELISTFMKLGPGLKTLLNDFRSFKIRVCVLKLNGLHLNLKEAHSDRVFRDADNK